MADERYLPPREPVDNPPVQKKQGRKTLLLWLLLIIVFIAIYQCVSHDPAGPPGEVAAEGGGPSTWVTMLSPAISVGLLVLVIGFIWWQLRGGSKLSQEQEPGLVALQEGRYDDAARIFGLVADKRRGQIAYASVARHNQAIAHLRGGDYAQAKRLLVAVERSPGLGLTSQVRIASAIALGRAYALEGDTDAAERWLEDARKKLGRGRERLSSAAELRMAEALLDTRRGAEDAALRSLENGWRNLEGTVTLSSMRSMWLLRAFLAARASAPRDQGEVEQWLSYLRPYREGEFRAMALHWPELRTFLASYGLT